MNLADEIYNEAQEKEAAYNGALFDISHLEEQNEALRKIIDKFIVKSNGLSMFVRSDIFGKSNLPKLDEQIWALYNYQCEVEDMLSLLV